MVEAKIQFYILVVIYKRSLLEAETIQSLLRSSCCSSQMNLFIWDNSPDDGNREYLNAIINVLGSNIKYIHSPTNTSMSKIFNLIISNYLFLKADLKQFLIILDQDSIFDSSFFKNLNIAIHQNDVNLFLPIVKAKGKIVSPGKLVLFYGSYWKKKKIGLISSKNKTAINSGMVISVNYLVNAFGGYDERLNFYGTDNYFMVEYSKHNDYFYVLDYELNHNLAKYSIEDKSTKNMRFIDNINSINVIYSRNLFMKIVVYIYIKFLVIKHLGIQYLNSKIRIGKA